MQSASRVWLLGLDFGLNLRHVDDIASFVRNTDTADASGGGSSSSGAVHPDQLQPAACEATTPTRRASPSALTERCTSCTLQPRVLSIHDPRMRV